MKFDVDRTEYLTMNVLKDFQRATVERIDALFRSGQNRILVADEVGMGKTLIARGVIVKTARLRLEKQDDLFKVVYAAFQIDEYGYDIENAINKMLPKNYDKNNAFDVKSGYGHRVFGHDAAALGIRNIPVDYIVHTKAGPYKNRQAYAIGKLVGAQPGQQYVSMWDLVWTFYGNKDDVLKGICNCLAHTIVHYAKDLYTPMGLPLPLTSLMNVYTHEFSDGRISEKYFSLQYKNSLIEDLDKNTLNMRASDFGAIVVIESLIEVYARALNCGALEKDYKRMMKIISMATCLIVGFTKMLYVDDLQLNKHNRIVSGSRINLLMTGLFAKNALQEFLVIMKANNDIKQGYKEWGKEFVEMHEEG